eukprot:g6127.t1
MDATALIDNSTVLTISTITKDPAAWLQFYTIAPRGFDWSPRRCGEGYEGALCGNCTTNSNNASWHFVRSSGKCRRCPSPVVAWLASILSFLVLALVAAFLIYRTVNKVVPVTTGALDTSNAERKDLLLPIIRQLISFCMLLGKVGSFQVGAVKAFRLASRYVSEATTGIGLGSYWFTCAVGWSFYGRLFVVAALPAVVAVICFLAVRLVLFRTSCRTFLRATITRYGDSENGEDGSVIDDARNHGEEKKGAEEDEEGQTARQPTNSLLLRARCYMDASVVYLFYLAFPTVVQQIFEALACTDITFVNGTSITYLTADFRVSCNDQAYQAARWLAIALVATHVILPPVLLAVWIRRNRSELQSAMAIRRMGFLYRGFKLDKYPWWGVVQLVTKVLIAGIVVFLDQELKQMAVAMVLFATLLLMQVALRPFSGAVLNNLQVVALMSLTVTQAVPIVVSSFFVANQQDRMQVINEGVAIAISIALVAFNGLTIILKSGWAGVYQSTSGRWHARVGLTNHEGRTIYKDGELFLTPEEAARSRPALIAKWRHDGATACIPRHPGRISKNFYAKGGGSGKGGGGLSQTRKTSQKKRSATRPWNHRGPPYLWVHKSKTSGRYRYFARVSVDGKTKDSKTFNTPEKAAAARSALVASFGPLDESKYPRSTNGTGFRNVYASTAGTKFYARISVDGS